MQFDSNGWLDVAIEIDYLSKSMDRRGYAPKYLILHGTAGGTSAQAIANYFASGSEQASAHFVIGVDGTIVQGVPCSLAAWANGPIDGTPADNLGFRTESDGVHRDSWWTDAINPNYITISIEHCKASTDNSDQLTPAQQDASFKLVACICDTYGIPKRFADANGGITGHFSMSAINRQHCPGTYPWQELFSYLKSGGNTNMATIPQGWTDNPQTGVLTAPNGHTVKAGFRGWILTHPWDGANQPLEEEHGVDPVEDYYAQTPSGGTRQLFEYCELAWTQARGVYVVGIGNELQGARKDRDIARAEIALIEKQLASAGQTALGQQVSALQAKITQAVKDLS